LVEAVNLPEEELTAVVFRLLESEAEQH